MRTYQTGFYLDQTMMVYPCGCMNETDAISGVLRSVSKCEHHRQQSGRGGMAHYLEMGCIIDGVPQHAKYAAELRECLRDMDCPIYPHNSDVSMTGVDDVALEIGSGLSMYAPMLMNLRYDYNGLEPDAEAAAWARSTFDVLIVEKKLEELTCCDTAFALIMAAHVFEHLQNAPRMIAKTFSLLQKGGRLILIVPDDEDPVNPDHLWFFTPTTLRSVLEDVGFKDVRMTVRRRVKHENFIYASAVKQ